jgi:ribosomal protein S18 acetylase RimI-like enzyme
MTLKPTFRGAVVNDSSHLAIHADSASRGLTSYIWSRTAKSGQSWMEVGREFIRTRSDHFIYYKNWHVAEVDGTSAAGLNCYVLPKETKNNHNGDGIDVTRNLNELKTLGAGTWYVAAASVFPEFRNLGIGESILTKAGQLACDRGISVMTLLVGSFNGGAQRLYSKLGFVEWDRRPFTSFPGSDPEGYWILMRRQLA